MTLTKSQLNEEAFLEPSQEIAGLKLRPFSLGSLAICRKLKLSLLTGEGEGEIGTEEQQNQILAFLFIQSQPVEEVLRAIKSADFMTDHVLPFSLTLPMSAFPAAIAAIQGVIDSAGAAFVEVLPKPGESAEDNPPN